MRQTRDFVVESDELFTHTAVLRCPMGAVSVRRRNNSPGQVQGGYSERGMKRLCYEHRVLVNMSQQITVKADDNGSFLSLTNIPTAVTKWGWSS